MEPARFVAGDWGTTNLRLYLCDESGRVIDQCAGPGAAGATGRFPSVLSSLIEPWRKRVGNLQTVLCGMVGSTIGWTSVPYVECPARPEQIARGCASLESGTVHLVPGLSCRNRLGAPDVMRGEETQILGALHLKRALGSGRHLLCLPGTHTKWAALDDGTVADFLTAPTGELFALLAEHSVLVPRTDADVDPADAAFLDGLAQFDRAVAGQLLHRHFECRSRRLAGELADSAAKAYLSGLLVASDVRGALRVLEGASEGPLVRVVGAPRLAALYSAALARRGLECEILDGADAVVAGLAHVRAHLRAASVSRAG